MKKTYLMIVSMMIAALFFTGSAGALEISPGDVAGSSDGSIAVPINISDAGNVEMDAKTTDSAVTIGQGSTLLSVNDNTAYLLPIFVFVSDTNGNSVSGARVFLGTWPIHYSTGYRGEPNECFIEIMGTYYSGVNNILKIKGENNADNKRTGSL
ncbi:hypothetical protein [Desulfonema magnum]|uniref:Uncharacterized protein n=1 Tax=Desulfonema magnum TaxID=45655 RepID=A0A975BNJ4_9BACT|nr:hypothetical protein [Desulfonema magnum]QTA88284.1 Uncharacterized protein dnm_043260 [Desulfonema magnum]